MHRCKKYKTLQKQAQKKLFLSDAGASNLIIKLKFKQSFNQTHP